MTDKEILQKVMDKVSKNGYLGNPAVEWNIHEAGVSGHWLLCLPDHKHKTKTHYNIEAIIFDHDFSKAFWGEYWQNRLQILVLEENPIKYLEKFL